MMWYLQLFAAFAVQYISSKTALNLCFAGLALWAGFGRAPRLCALCTAALHLALIFL